MTSVFAVHTIAALILESLLSNASVNGNSPKVPGYHSLFFIFSFDIHCVSRNFTTFSCLHVFRKILLMWFNLSVELERTVRFAATVDVVLIIAVF